MVRKAAAQVSSGAVDGRRCAAAPSGARCFSFITCAAMLRAMASYCSISWGAMVIRAAPTALRPSSRRSGGEMAAQFDGSAEDVVDDVAVLIGAEAAGGALIRPGGGDGERQRADTKQGRNRRRREFITSPASRGALCGDRHESRHALPGGNRPPRSSALRPVPHVRVRRRRTCGIGRKCPPCRRSNNSRCPRRRRRSYSTDRLQGTIPADDHLQACARPSPASRMCTLVSHAEFHGHQRVLEHADPEGPVPAVITPFLITAPVDIAQSVGQDLDAIGHHIPPRRELSVLERICSSAARSTVTVTGAILRQIVAANG